MDFLSSLLRFFSGENNFNPILDVIGKLQNGNLNFSDLLSPDVIQNVMPVFKEMFSNFNQNKNPTGDQSVGDFNRLSPVESFADREIVCALNSYLGG